VSAALLVVAFAAGLVAQRVPADERVRSLTWLVYFWTVAPILVFVVFRTVHVDGGLVLALGAAIASTWLVALVAYAYAYVTAPTRDERGALALAAACPNTGFLGFPLAKLAFGSHGLALAVVYDQLSWLVPATAVTTTVARIHGRGPGRARERPLRALLVNPPLLALALALALRAAGVGIPGTDGAGRLAGDVVGPAGFFLLGLSLPLERPAHEREELGRALGALLIRFAAGPLALLAVGRAVGADVPGVFYLLAAMPAAFHLLVLARVYEMRPALMRLLVVGSTLPAVAAVVVATELR
jgi:predicted permease